MILSIKAATGKSRTTPHTPHVLSKKPCHCATTRSKLVAAMTNYVFFAYPAY